jgi:integrase
MSRVDSHWQNKRLVFPAITGTINLRGRYFKPLLERAGLPASGLHDLRHTCATIFLMAGKYPKYVQGLLGHAIISITLDIYSHLSRGWTAGSGTLSMRRCDLYCCRIAAIGVYGYFPERRIPLI